jgi:hypothetical protein
MSVIDQMSKARRQARWQMRSAHRAAVGALGLSPAATVHWLWTQVGHHLTDPVAAAENSSFTWAVADDDLTTRVWLHNYWSDAYGIERPVLDATLIDGGGCEVATWVIALAPNATEVIDVREQCRQAGQVLPFEGQLLLRLAHDNVVAGRPVQVFAEYVGDCGEATGVHGQYGLVEKPFGQLISGMRVEAGRGVRTAVVFANTFEGSHGGTAMRTGLEVRNAAGQRRHLQLDRLAPRATQRVYLDDAFPGLAAFLGGSTGHMRLQLPCPTSRVANFVEFGDGRRVVNHGTVDRTFDQGRGRPPSWTESWPVASALGVCTERRDTVLTFPNVFGPIAGDYDVRTDVYAPSGDHIGTRVTRVPQGGLGQCSLRDALHDWGVALPAFVHAEVSVHPIEGIPEWPAYIDILVAIVDDATLAAEVQVGGEFFNAAIPDGIPAPDIRRTRTFGRVEVTAGSTTWLFLANPAGRTGYDVTANPMLTLFDLEGTAVATARLEVPPHGCVLIQIADLFSAGMEALGDNGSGVVRVRDTSARLYGYYCVETAGARTMPICHLIGG